MSTAVAPAGSRSLENRDVETGNVRRRPAMLSPRAIAWGPRLAQMVITRKCNLSCGYCNEYDKVSEPVPAETIKSWVDKLARFRCLFVEFTGGETLLHPELVDLVAYASRYRFLERWIITNGYLLTADIVKGLNDAGLTHMQISIDGVTPNDTTVKVLKPLRNKLRYLEQHARFRVQVNAVLGAGNDREALDVVSYARDAGFIPRVSVLHDGDGQIGLSGDARELVNQVSAAVGKRWGESGDYRARLMSEGRAPFRCRAGSRYLYIDEHGDVHWCSQQRGVFRKPFADYDWADLKEQFYTRKACSDGCTVGCVRTASRFDEWRSQPLEPVPGPSADTVPVARLTARGQTTGD